MYPKTQTKGKLGASIKRRLEFSAGKTVITAININSFIRFDYLIYPS